MSLTYTNPTYHISNTVPDDQLSERAQADTLAQQLGGQVVNMVDIIAPGSLIVLSEGETRGWWGITVDQQKYSGVYTPIVATVLLTEQAAGAGFWHVNPANGQPMWVVTPKPLPIPQPTQTGTGSFMPGAAYTATDVMRRLFEQFGPSASYPNKP